MSKDKRVPIHWDAHDPKFVSGFLTGLIFAEITQAIREMNFVEKRYKLPKFDQEVETVITSRLDVDCEVVEEDGPEVTSYATKTVVFRPTVRRPACTLS